MPIDAQIPLMVQPPPQANQLDSLARVLSIKNAVAQQPLIQAEIERAGLQNQQLGQQIGATNALNQAYKSAVMMSPDGTPTIDKAAITNTLAKGGYGSQIPTIMEHLTKYDTDLATLQKKKNELELDERNALGSAGLAAHTADYNPEVFLTALDLAAAHGYKTAAQVKQAVLQDPTKIKTFVDQAIASSPEATKTLSAGRQAAARESLANTAETREKREATKSAAELPGIQVKAQSEQRQADATVLAGAAKQGPDALKAALGELPYGRAKVFEGLTDPNAILQLGMKPAEITSAEAAAAGHKETARHNVVTEQQGVQRIQQGASRLGIERQNTAIRAVSADPFNQSGVNPHPMAGPPEASGGAPSGEAFLQTIPPAMRATVKAIAEGRQAPYGNARTGAALQIMNAVQQYDPEWSAQKAQIRKAFATGADGKNIGALNTAAVHLDQLADAAEAMKNGSFRPGNQLFNAVSTMFGGAAPTNFEGIKAAVSGEMATALKGNATDQEIASIKATIDRSASPEQMRGAVQTGLHILGAKLNTYQERYQQQIPGDKWSPVLPSSAAVFQKYNVGTGGRPGSAAPAKPAPAVGIIEQGFRFKGGNPADPNSWEKEKAQAK